MDLDTYLRRQERRYRLHHHQEENRQAEKTTAREYIPATDRQPTKETAMRAPSRTASRAHHIVCPFCESGELVTFGPGLARCGSCGLPLLGSMLETLSGITGLPDALGAHPCECGHPEMRELPDGVFHCPACRSEVVPFEARRSLLGSPAGSMEGYTGFPAGGVHAKP